MTRHSLQKLPPEGSQPTARLSTCLCQGAPTPSTSRVNSSIYFSIYFSSSSACLFNWTGVLCAACTACWSAFLGKYNKPRIPSLSSTTKNLPLLSTAPHRNLELINKPSFRGKGKQHQFKYFCISYQHHKLLQELFQHLWCWLVLSVSQVLQPCPIHGAFCPVG